MRAVGVDWEDQPRRKVTKKIRSKKRVNRWPFAVSGAGGYRFRRPTSSARWRSLRPPNVLLGETRQPFRILVAFTLPTLGEGQQHVEDLRGLKVRGRVEQQRTDRHPARLEIAL
jgi:hypothetical protein